ncbi:MAG: hypothetical protein JNL58_10025 [Planctomyces sp.]|nr:hypothetical protein [Planctomyces sp.]
MSVGRERSWRPERSIPRRRERKLKLFLAVGLLTALVLALVYMIWTPPVQPVRFVSLSPSGVRVSLGDVLPLPEDLGAKANIHRFEALMQASQAAEPSLIRDSQKLESLQSLQSLKAGSEERLLLYCSLKARVSARSGEPSLEFGFDEGDKSNWDTAQSFFGSLTSSQYFPRPRLLVVLLELENQGLGIHRDSSGSDTFRLLEKVIQDLNEPGLVVVTACGNGERSWEYLTEKSVSQPKAATEESAGAAIPVAVPRVVYNGTAFGHFACEVVVDNKANTVQELFQELRDRVQSYVAETYRTDQTVKMLTAKGESSGAELFAGIKPPVRADYNSRLRPSPTDSGLDQTAKAGEEAGSSESEQKQTDGDGAKAAETTEAEPTREERITLLWNALPAADSDAAAFPFDLWICQSALLRAEQLLLHQRLDESDLAREFADKQLAALNRKLTRLHENTIADQVESSVTLKSWLGLQLNQSLTAQQVAECDALLEALKAPESRPDLIPADKKTAAFQNQLVTYLIRRVDETAPLAEARSEQLLILKKVLTHPAFADLNSRGRTSLPFTTLRHLVQADRSTTDGWSRLKMILRLLEARRQAIAIAVGADPVNGSSLIGKELWHQLLNSGDGSGRPLQSLLTRLTSVESWLALGETGEARAEVLLRQAENDIAELVRVLRARQGFENFAGSQRVMIPYLVQFYASLDEQMDVSAAVLEGVDRTGRIALPGDRRKAMLELTAKIASQDSSPEVTDRLNEHLSGLWKELNDKAASGFVGTSRMTSAEHRNLELIPPFQAYASRPLPGFRPAFAGDDTAELPALRNTGLWMGFWSIRLLECLGTSSGETDLLWNQWDELKLALQHELTSSKSNERTGTDRTSSPVAPASPLEPSPAIAIRAKLFSELREAWLQLENESVGSDDLQTVTQQDFGPVVQAFLEKRRAFDWEIRTQYRMSADSAAALPAVIRSANETLVADGMTPMTLGVEIQSPPEPCQLLLHAPGFHVAGDNAPSDVWQKLADVTSESAQSHLKFQLIRDDGAGALTSTQDAELLVVSDQDQILERKKILILPRLKTEWRLDVRHKGAPVELLELGRGRRQLTLPPSVSQAALDLQLTRTMGTADRVRVELFEVDIDGNVLVDPLIWRQELVLEAGKNSLTLPMIPAATAPAAAVPPAAANPTSTNPSVVPAGALSTDLEHGFALRLTSIIPELEAANAPADSTMLQVMLKCSGIEAYVALPQVSYNAVSRMLEIQLFRQVNDSVLRPAKLPVEVHFSPQLRRLLPELTGHLREDIAAGGEVFRFQFSDGIKQMPEEGAIFAVSVGGVPYAWGWKLTADEGVVPLGDLAGTELLVTLDYADIKAINSTNKLLFGEDALTEKAMLTPRVHLFGKTWDVGQPPALELGIVSVYPELPEKSLYQVAEVDGRWKQSKAFAPGENGAWNVSTATTSWGPDRGFLLVENGWRSGQYELRAYLTRRDQNSTVQEDLPFVVDVTEPLVPEVQIQGRDDEGRIPFDQPLKILLSGVVDPESGVMAIEAGCEEQKLSRVWPPLPNTKAIDRTTSIPIEVSSNAFGEFEAGEKDINRPLTVFVKLINSAGQSTVVKREIRVFRPGMMTKESAEPVPFSLTLQITETVQGTIVARLDNLPAREGKAGEVIQFRNLTEGQHRISWKEKVPIPGQNISNSRTIMVDKEGKPILIEVKP